MTCQPDAHELPARMGRKEIAVGRAKVRGGRGERSSAQDKLIAHEFSVVLAYRTGSGTEARIGEVGAGGPLP